MFKRSFVAAAVAVGLLVSAAPAGAGGGMTVLGRDPSLDAAPGSDLTQLAVASHGSDLHIRFTFANSLPVAGTYGPLTGIQWAFRVGKKTFVAEAYPSGATFRYVLFEKKGESFEQVATLEGEFDTIAGILDVFVPLKTIGAKKGTKIVGAGKNDVDVHVHGLVTTYYADQMTTKKGFVVR
ncbi:MAG: hypothetical protein KY391_08320 [Actinobacteria bacterium]|nr:hypothetical protein [Actinomycetota bacterium]